MLSFKFIGLPVLEKKILMVFTIYILDSNENAYFDFGVILYERRFALMLNSVKGISHILCLFSNKIIENGSLIHA